MALEETLNLYRPASLDYGQVYYLVDDNFRTAAQGWSRPDRTGPLDLYEARKAGRGGTQYVFQNKDYSSDAVAAQAAIDSAIDFRGDTLFLPNGSHSWSVVVTVDVPDLKITGQSRSDKRLTGCTITDAIGSHVLSAAADRVEVAWLHFIPKTAVTFWSAAAGADQGYWHDFFYDTDGIAASTSTILLTHAGATMDHWRFANFMALIDAAQGPVILASGAYRSVAIEDFELYVEAGTWASAFNFTSTAASIGPLNVRRGTGKVSGGGAATALITSGNSTTDTARISVNDFRGAIGFCAAGGLVNLGGDAAATVGIANCFLDVVSAGAGGAGTAYTA